MYFKVPWNCSPWCAMVNQVERFASANESAEVTSHDGDKTLIIDRTKVAATGFVCVGQSPTMLFQRWHFYS